MASIWFPACRSRRRRLLRVVATKRRAKGSARAAGASAVKQRCGRATQGTKVVASAAKVARRAADVLRKRRTESQTSPPSLPAGEAGSDGPAKRQKREAARAAGLPAAIVAQLEGEVAARRAAGKVKRSKGEGKAEETIGAEAPKSKGKAEKTIGAEAPKSKGKAEKAIGAEASKLESVEGRSAGAQGHPEACALRASLQICIEDDPYGDCPAPASRFQDLPGLPAFVLQSLAAHGIKAPLPIQAQALPLVLAGRDVIGLAQTGSGKTLAFLIPIAVRIGKGAGVQPAVANEPVALVLAPTRELAVQIADEAGKIFEGCRGAEVACVYGGGDKYKQQQKLARGVHVLVATPGRLLDFAESRHARLGAVSYFVLDEADRMLDMGFHEDVVSIAGQAKAKRQTLFFSATWDPRVQDLARSLCRSKSQPVRISYAQNSKQGVDSNGEAPKHTAREGIVQEVVVIDCKGPDHWETQEKLKNELLDKHLRKVMKASPEHKILVFVSQKNLADKVSGRLQAEGFKADAMHGGRSQECRLWVLDQFRKGEIRMLVCTDVLGRGIDIPSVSHVVIHEMGETEDYIHRIGRTARGQYGKGHALVFFEYWEGYPQIAAELVAILEASKQAVPQDLRRIAGEVAAGKRPTKGLPWKR